MRRAWLLFPLIILLVIADSSQGQVSQPPPDELRSLLEKRVSQLNTALSSHEFQLAWDLLGPGLKKDNPKEQYVERLKTKIGKWEVQSKPDVSFAGTTQKTGRPIGQVYSKVNVTTPSGQLVPIVHRTTWLWFNDRDGNRSAWYLAQEHVQEQSSTR